jgi:phosphoenolpyruvate-protein kinase (PTS system EI component)
MNVSHGFVEAHILLLNDNALHSEVEDLIKNKHINALDSFVLVIDKYIKIMQNSTDEYLKERYLDFLDIKSRVVQNLNKQIVSLSNLEECILLVDELFPSVLINMSKNVKGIIAKKGGYTSHSAILCRNLGIPYVVVNYPEKIKGKILIDNDKVIINPSLKCVLPYKNKKQLNEKINKDLKDIKVWANVINNDDILNVSEEFSGIGLYRTEFVLNDLNCAFDIEKQTEIYSNALRLAKGRPVVFRTFDIGDDKRVDYLPILEKGIKNYYLYPRLFENQIIAILTASKLYPKQVKIMFPMIENIMQYQELKKYIVKKARELKVKVPPIGMMLETQYALINLSNFNTVDFISVGTNYLCSELFNVSREEVVLFENIYSDLLNVLEKIINFCRINNISLSVCGELINQTEFAKKAIKLGLKNVSIGYNSLNNIYKAINEE